MKTSFLLFFGAFLMLPVAARALTPGETAYFESKVRPILVQNCYKCHSQEASKLKGGLSVETREGLLTGGETGPALIPGNIEKSLLIKAIHYTDADLKMPPDNKKLTVEQIDVLEKWVKMGAPDPRLASTLTKPAGKSDKDHWSFKPVTSPNVPLTTKNREWVKNPVDTFVLDKLHVNGMEPNPIADKRVLIRRATYDLIGLPPTIEETENFLKDSSPEAFAKVVDRLLASPQYGERWGRYWLDVARYSDTKGEVKKQREDPRNPYAWTYRDYVIKAFNDDKPFNQFIVEQLAADKIQLSTKQSLAALGFLTVGDHFNENRHDVINDQIDVVTKGFLGLTVTCARCHDHKFDPIPTKDYYSLYGIFANSVEPVDQPVLHTSTNAFDVADYVKKSSDLKRAMFETQQKIRSKVADPKIARRDLTRDRQALTELDVSHPGAPTKAMTVADVLAPRDYPVFIRGEADNKGEVVPRRFLEILSGPTRTPYKVGSGRLDLARAIASDKNPMTARTLVNRVWLHHFGQGFVNTPDDLGNQSEAPSHPELLDYLASRFMKEGWSIKSLHRIIMLSSTYQQASSDNAQYAIKDPNNRLLWRSNLRRLDLEAIRDSLLAMGDKLDLTMGGRPVQLGHAPYSTRRTVYGYIDRRDLPEIYTQFDFANPDVTMGKRYETVVPQQSLFMMNSPLVVEQARNIINKTDFIMMPSDEKRVEYLYMKIFQRDPSAEEIKLGLQFVENSPLTDRAPMANMMLNRKLGPRKQDKLAFTELTPENRKPVSRWEKYAHALLQTNEAMFLN